MTFPVHTIGGSVSSPSSSSVPSAFPCVPPFAHSMAASTNAMPPVGGQLAARFRPPVLDMDQQCPQMMQGKVDECHILFLHAELINPVGKIT